MKRIYVKTFNWIIIIPLLLSFSMSMLSSMTVSAQTGTNWDPQKGVYIGTERSIATDIMRSIQLIPYTWQGAKASHDNGYGWLSGAIDGTLMALDGEYYSLPGQAYNIISDRFTTSGDGLLSSALSSIPSNGSNMYYSYTGDTDNSTTNYHVFTDLSSHDTYNYQWYNPITNNYNYTDYFYYDYDYNTYYYNYTQNNYKYDYFYTDNSTYNTFYIIQTDTETGEEVEYLYNIFYRLPDGRSSYNLQKEDVWGQYLLYKTRPYYPVAEDDGKTLGLWHFNQSLEDSSYWGNTSGTCGNLQYQEGMFESGKYIAPDTNIVLNLNLDKVTFNLHDSYTIEWIEKTPIINATVKNTQTVLEHNQKKQYKFNEYDYYNMFICPNYGYVNLNSYLGANTYYAITYNGIGYKLYINGIEQNTVSYNNGIHNYQSKYLDSSWNSMKYNGLNPYINVSQFYPGLEITSDSIKIGANKFSYERDLIPLTGESVTNVYNPNDGSFGNVYSVEYYNTYYACSHWGSVIDEMRLSRGVLYTGDYSPSAEPYTTNMVLTLPSDPEENEIFFFTGYSYDNFRIGGVRPTYPLDGCIYVYLEEDIVKNVQQYQTNHWVEITGTIYKDGSAHDLINYSLSDYKLHEPDKPNSGNSPGTTTSGNSSGNGDNNNPGSNTGDNSGGDTENKGNWFTDFLGKVGGFLGDAGRQLLSFIVDTVFGIILDLFSAVLELLGSLLDMLKNAFSTITGFLNADFAQFLADTFVFIPKEFWDVILLSVELAVLAAVIKILVDTLRS